MRCGFTFDDVPHRLSWRALAAFIFHGAQQAGTALYREAVDPWGLDTHLLAATVDLLNQGNWQRAAAGRKTPPKRPQRIPRPGEKLRARMGTAMPLSELKLVMAQVNPLQHGD